MLSIIIGFFVLYFLLCLNNTYIKEGAFFSTQQNKDFVDNVIKKFDDVKKKSKKVNNLIDKNNRLHTATTKVAKKHMNTVTEDSKATIKKG